MGVLPRPEGLEGPLRDLFDALHDLHHRAGRPSLRQMAKEVGCSHTTVSVAFSGPALPRWGLIELLVETLGGDTERFHGLWLAAGTDPARPPAAAPAGRLVPRQLPGDVPVFTGRVRQLAELDRLLSAPAASGAVAICALSGTAGVGKTALAVHWAHRAAPAFPDGQLYLNLRGYDPERPVSAAEALEVFLRALGVEGPAVPHGLDERAALYRTLLAGRRVLVVLDNVRGIEQVRELLPGTPSCQVLVTSRDSLPSLVARYGAVRLTLDVLPGEDASDLLARLIGARAEAEPGHTAALAERCARLPLALRIAAELAAARPGVPLARLVADLGDESRRLDLLNAGEDDHTAVRAVFSWSCRALPEPALDAFHLLGLHPGPDLSAAAAAALLGVEQAVAYRQLDTLARAHLVDETDVGRFTMHDLLRAYAAEQAATRPDRESALLRLFDHYAEAAHRTTDPHAPWLAAERRNLLAVAAASAGVSPRHTLALSAGLDRLLDTAAHYRDALALHALALDAARALGDRAAEAAALNRLGHAHLRTGSYTAAVRHHQEALDAHRVGGDRLGEADALHGLGTLSWRLGRYEDARAHLEAALALRRELADTGGEGAALYGLGTVHRQLGDYPRALDHQERALVLFREHGDRIGQARVLNNLGTTLERTGRYLEAYDHYARALSINREIGNRVGEAVALTNLGSASLRLGHLADAAAHHEAALPIYVETDYRSGQAEALRGIGTVHLAAGRHEDALDLLGRAVALAHEVGEAEVETGALIDLGETQLALGLRADAGGSHAAALDLAERSGDRYEQARALAGLARLSDAATARRHRAAAAALFDALGVPEAAETHRLLEEP
ncbi:tetratricopeptide repeat protein [Streptomyces sp. TRM66268-LWL]|uniref:Tetratricopeptide repeat protein n=1 Tax=Streptomyces polyasparticus TaxID=2767826 RepID=A0ABR7SU92_9ACTN|nr:tetratricopeptide repeat protein [Streptomyces polyasparticus]MBC9719041.1 tetratricopeptide repeat protein [Streptomyces polyasparticus]